MQGSKIDRWREQVAEHTGVQLTREQAVKLAATIIMQPKSAQQINPAELLPFGATVTELANTDTAGNKIK